jgi:hypothetical protein
MPARIKMIVMTISISISEKPAAEMRRRVDTFRPRRFRQSNDVMLKKFICV